MVGLGADRKVSRRDRPPFNHVPIIERHSFLYAHPLELEDIQFYAADESGVLSSIRLNGTYRLRRPYLRASRSFKPQCQREQGIRQHVSQR
jgi:hypothetical protein